MLLLMFSYYVTYPSTATDITTDVDIVILLLLLLHLLGPVYSVL